MEKTSQFASELKNEFKSTPGWLKCFKKRRRITFRVSGEVASAPKEDASAWASGQMQEMFAKYESRDILNADETGL